VINVFFHRDRTSCDTLQFWFGLPAIGYNGSPVSAVRLNGDKRAIYGCLNEVGNLSFIIMPAWHLPAC